MDNKVGRRRKSPIVQHLNDYSLKTCQAVQALSSNLDKREVCHLHDESRFLVDWHVSWQPQATYITALL